MTLQMLTDDHLTLDPAQVDFTGDAGFGAGQRWCGGQAPVVLSNGTRMTLMFRSDDLFRYQVPLTRAVLVLTSAARGSRAATARCSPTVTPCPAPSATPRTARSPG